MKVWILTGEDHDYDVGSSDVLAVFADETKAKAILAALDAVKLPGSRGGGRSEGAAKAAKAELNAILPGAGDFSWLHALCFNLFEMDVT